MKYFYPFRIFVALALGLVTYWSPISLDAENNSMYALQINEKAKFSNELVEECHDPELDDSQWQIMGLSELSENSQYCLRIKLTLKDEPRPASTVLWTAMLGTYEVYWDGKYLARTGIVASSVAKETVGPMSKSMFVSPRQLSPGEHLISLRVSTHHHTEDLMVIFYGMMLVDWVELGNREQQSRIAPLMFAGALLLLFIFFQLVFWYYQKDRTFLLFSMMCFFASVLIGLEELKYYWAYPWDVHTVRLKVIIGVVTLTGACLLSYYVSLYRQARMAYWLAAYLVLAAIAIVFLPSYDFRSWAIFLASITLGILINFQALRRKLRTAIVNTLFLAVGFALLFVLPYDFIDKWFAALFSIIA
ncbi:MAG: hypothetical protein OQJ89_13420, partial [Kangiellaceae bacterium]|nr:hypothetical protein [Kangiellaceae bacterium]